MPDRARQWGGHPRRCAAQAGRGLRAGGQQSHAGARGHRAGPGAGAQLGVGAWRQSAYRQYRRYRNHRFGALAVARPGPASRLIEITEKSLAHPSIRRHGRTMRRTYLLVFLALVLPAVIGLGYYATEIEPAGIALR